MRETNVDAGMDKLLVLQNLQKVEMVQLSRRAKKDPNLAQAERDRKWTYGHPMFNLFGHGTAETYRVFDETVSLKILSWCFG
jgi:hypothetical protein